MAGFRAKNVISSLERAHKVGPPYGSPEEPVTRVPQQASQTDKQVTTGCALALIPCSTVYDLGCKPSMQAQM